MSSTKNEIPIATLKDDTSQESDVSTAEMAHDVKKKSVSGAISYFIRTLFLQGLALGSGFILSALFDASDFAIYGFVVQFVSLLVFFSDVGLAAALVQKKSSPSEKEYASAFTVQQMLSWFIVVLLCAILPFGFIQNQVGQTGVWILLSLAFSFPLASLKTIPSIMLERELQFNKLVVPQIWEQIAFYGILVGLALIDYGAIAYAYAIIARAVVGVTVMWFIQPWKPSFALDNSALKVLLSFGAKFQLNDFLARIKDQLFYIVLGTILATEQFGFVIWAKTWSMMPYNLTVQNVMAVTFPAFSRLQHYPALLARAIEKSLFFISCAIFPLVVLICFFIWPLVELIPAYQKWLPALPSLVWFTLSIGFSAISTPLTNALNAIGQINATLKLMILWTVLTWVITPLFWWMYGYTGISVAAACISLTSFIPVFMVKKIVAFSFLDQVWLPFLATVVMSIVGLIIFDYLANSWLTFVVGAAGMVVVYLLTLLAFGKTKVVNEILSLKKVSK